jgi:hypothetical protein
MRSKKYLAFVRTLPCCHCENPETVPHHIIAVDSMGRMGGKASDLATCPMCSHCHRILHADATGWPQTRYVLETLEQAYNAGVLKNV